jgi:transcription antitermination factor NusG
MQGDAPVPLPRGVVEVLKDRTDANGAFDWAPSLRVGQAVEISDGPFADFVGTLESLDDHGRVRVLLDLLGRSVSVSLRRNVLMPVA